MFVEFEEGGGALEVSIATLAAFGLDVAELLESLLKLAGETLAMEAQGGEGAVGVHDVERHGWVGVGGGGRVHGAGEKIGFEERDTIETPRGGGEFLRELFFGGSPGLVFVEKCADMLLVSGEIFRRQDWIAASEAVSESIERRAMFAVRGAGSGGVAGVRLIDAGAVE